jgi:Orsellinic acid/F9775 biosynthesis cluster protein D
VNQRRFTAESREAEGDQPQCGLGNSGKMRLINVQIHDIWRSSRIEKQERTKKKKKKKKDTSHDLHSTIDPTPFSRIMTHESIRFLSRHGVLLCVLCERPHCIPLNGLAQYLRMYHEEGLNKKRRREIVRYANTFKPSLVVAEDVIEPEEELRPVYGLYIYMGHECVTCGRLFPEESSMKQHCRSHGWDSTKPKMWTSDTYIQVCDRGFEGLIVDLLQRTTVCSLFQSKSTTSTAYESIRYRTIIGSSMR